jgi:hypothetical protein
VGGGRGAGRMALARAGLTAFAEGRNLTDKRYSASVIVAAARASSSSPPTLEPSCSACGGLRDHEPPLVPFSDAPASVVITGLEELHSIFEYFVTSRSASLMRRGQTFPPRYFSGSGFPIPANGSCGAASIRSSSRSAVFRFVSTPYLRSSRHSSWRVARRRRDGLRRLSRPRPVPAHAADCRDPPACRGRAELASTPQAGARRSAATEGDRRFPADSPTRRPGSEPCSHGRVAG